MDYLQAIDSRISRRSYTGPVPAKDAKPLAALCEALSEEYGVHFALVTDGAAKLFGGFAKSYGLLTNVQGLITLGVPANNPENLEKVGHGGEKLALEATCRGLGTCWVGGTFDKDALQRVAPAGVEIVGVLTIGAIAEAQSGKEKFFRNAMHRKSKTAAQMSAVQGTAPAWFMAGVEAAVKAPSAVHGQPVTFHWQEGAATASVPGARSMQYIDLGIAKLHFELAAGGRFTVGNGGAFVPGA